VAQNVILGRDRLTLRAGWAQVGGKKKVRTSGGDSWRDAMNCPYGSYRKFSGGKSLLTWWGRHRPLPRDYLPEALPGPRPRPNQLLPYEFEDGWPHHLVLACVPRPDPESKGVENE
jgi:hypothetical protein